MKKFITILFILPLIFSSCEKEDNSPNSNSNNSNNPLNPNNTTIGYLVTNNGVVYKTTDSGINWNYQGDPSVNTFVGVSFVNTTTGYLVTNGGGVYKTTDSGINWNYQGDPSGNFGVFVGVSFPFII